MKSQATGQMHLIAPTDGQVSVMTQYIEAIGGDRNILSSHENEQTRSARNSQIYMKWFQALVVHNRRFPRDIPIKFVLSHFARKVIQNEVEINGFNLREQVRAFHEYLDGWEHELRGKWWQYQNPQDRPEALPESATTSAEEENQSDQQRSKMIQEMYGAEDIPESLQKFI